MPGTKQAQFSRPGNPIWAFRVLQIFTTEKHKRRARNIELTRFTAEYSMNPAYFLITSLYPQYILSSLIRMQFPNVSTLLVSSDITVAQRSLSRFEIISCSGASRFSCDIWNLRQQIVLNDVKQSRIINQWSSDSSSSYSILIAMISVPIPVSCLNIHPDAS